MKILVLGASGMLGNAVFRLLSIDMDQDVYGTARSEELKKHLDDDLAQKVICNINIENSDSLNRLFLDIKPDFVINCIGLIKQLVEVDDPLIAIPINALLPHRLAKLCKLYNARFIHISTDCVFSGSRGNYSESDFCDADDLYGRSKLLGEVLDLHAITLRTSIIGHELITKHALIDWFLSQDKSVKGYKNAIFSGLPTVELARVIRDFVMPNANLTGVFHVAVAPISKFDLLNLVAEVYGKTIQIIPDDSVVMNRSLNASKFKKATGYIAPDWKDLVTMMHKFQ
jgi:dTDP-4-dehydrorhamnose reductase